MPFWCKRLLWRSLASRRETCLVVCLTCWGIFIIDVLVVCSSGKTITWCMTSRPHDLSATISRRNGIAHLAQGPFLRSNTFERRELKNETAFVIDNNDSLITEYVDIKKEIRYNDDNKRHLKLQKTMHEKGDRKMTRGEHDTEQFLGKNWSPKQTKRLADYYTLSNKIINPLDRKFNILNDKICRNDSLQMIILVPSIPENFEIRTAIRNTFGKLSRDRLSQINGAKVEYIVRVAFLLGRSPNHTIEQSVRRENAGNKDVVEIDFVDSYYNLTLKILYGLKWAHAFCNKVKYVVKSDEDVFLNTAGLIKQLKLHDEGSNGAVFGTIFHKQLTVLREGRWGVSRDQYPPSQYPEYAQGNSYTISGKLIPNIVEVAMRLPYIPVEDAFITGIMAGKFCKARLISIRGNSNWQEKTFVPNPCKFVKYNLVSTTNMTPKLMYKTFDALKHYKSKCYTYAEKGTQGQ